MKITAFPAEWEQHESTWLAWPAADELWGDDLKGAQKEFTALASEIAKSEEVNMLAVSAHAEEDAQKALSASLKSIRFHQIPYGDIWLRDIGCIFLRNTEPGPDKILAQVFKFNGWGGKYVLEGDQECGLDMAKDSRHPLVLHDFIFEGGSIENDGEGNCLTTEECLLNPNRNPNLKKADIEKLLKNIFGFEKIHWIKKGLLFDHTDGHIDNIARFIAPGHIVCMEATDADDPQKAVMDTIYKELQSFRTASGSPFKITRVPAPGPFVKDRDGALMPASYLNFVFTKDSLIVPIYGTKNDAAALEILQNLVKDSGRKVVGLNSNKILLGGGSFHCISQQEPKP